MAKKVIDKLIRTEEPNLACELPPIGLAENFQSQVVPWNQRQVKLPTITTTEDLDEVVMDPLPIDIDEKEEEQAMDQKDKTIFRVYIVGTDYSCERLFTQRTGYRVTRFLEYADVILFTGGADIQPELYGQKPITEPSRVHTFPYRDEVELSFINGVKGILPMIGICRGAQLLNVVSGGSMYQHIDHHHGSHEMVDVETKQIIPVTSIHHQMMKPDLSKCKILAVANMSHNRWDAHGHYVKGVHFKDWDDPEALWYPETKSLCFQGHPEYADRGYDLKGTHAAACVDYFFNLVEKYIRKPILDAGGIPDALRAKIPDELFHKARRGTGHDPYRSHPYLF